MNKLEWQDQSIREQAVTSLANQQPISGLYGKLFKSTFLISAFTVGGGFVIVPLLKAKFVDEYKWIDNKEALNLVAIAQSSPGVVAINASIILGYRLGGWLGLGTALLATILPPLLFLTTIAYFYNAFIHNPYIAWILKGMQVAATAVILQVGYKLIKDLVVNRVIYGLIIAVTSFVASYFFDVNIMYIVIACALIGLIFLRRV